MGRTGEGVEGGVKTLLQLANFTLGPDAFNAEIHKNSVRIKAAYKVNASKRKHKNQINHYDEQRRVLMANSTTHFENTPIQIYWKFYHQKMKIFR